MKRQGMNWFGILFFSLCLLSFSLAIIFNLVLPSSSSLEVLTLNSKLGCSWITTLDCWYHLGVFWVGYSWYFKNNGPSLSSPNLETHWFSRFFKVKHFSVSFIVFFSYFLTKMFFIFLISIFYVFIYLLLYLDLKTSNELEIGEDECYLKWICHAWVLVPNGEFIVSNIWYAFIGL